VNIPFQPNVARLFKLKRRQELDALKRKQSSSSSSSSSSSACPSSVANVHLEKNEIGYYGLRQVYIATNRKGILKYKRNEEHDVLRGIFRERLRTVVNILPYNVNSTTQSIAGVNMC